MSDQMTPGQLAVDTYLDSMASRNELIPGAREYLAKRFAASVETGGLASLVNFLADPAESSRYLNPERVETRPEAPLRKHLRRFAGVLHEGEADQLYDRFAMDVDPAALERNPGEVVADLWQRMQTFEHRGRWLPRFRPELDRRTRAVLDVLEDLEDHLSPRARNQIEQIAHEWRDVGGRSRAEVARIVAKRLSLPMYAHLTATGQPAEIEHDEYVQAGKRDPDPAHAGLVEQFVRTGGYDVM